MIWLLLYVLGALATYGGLRRLPGSYWSQQEEEMALLFTLAWPVTALVLLPIVVAEYRRERRRLRLPPPLDRRAQARAEDLLGLEGIYRVAQHYPEQLGKEERS